jgi:Raf kinase inhibitor-like YbhB/YbcL family protein
MKTSTTILGCAMGLAMLLGFAACGSDEASPTGDGSAGGATNSAGQASSAGGAASLNPSTGGADGGTSAAGASTGTGNSSSTAGASAGGVSTGGAVTGGRRETGGADGTGGATTAGVTSSTGGVTTGGSSAGGDTAAGKASGGAGTGGSSATGGVSMAGGSGGGSDGGAVGIGGASGGAGGGASSASGGSDSGAFVLTSPELSAGGTFLADNTCAGLNLSPSLSWTPGPAGTLGYAIVLQDLSNSLYHWTLWNLAPTTLSLAAAIPAGTTSVAGLDGAQQRSTAQTGAYQGPCPRGTLHTYRFTVYAVDALPLPGVTSSSTPSQVALILLEHALATATLEGTSDATRP